MRQLKRVAVEEDLSGSVLLLTEEAEDAWHLLNLVTPGDEITASTIRKVKLESGTAVASAKKQLRLTLRVKSVDYDSQTGCIRFSGVNVTENEFVKLGQHHTIEIDAKDQEKLSLHKPPGGWDAYTREYLQDACAMEKTAELAVLLLDEALGTACLYAVGEVLIRDVFKVQVTISRKHNEKQIAAFHEATFRELFKHLDLKNFVKCLVVAGPGFGKDNFHRFVTACISNNSTSAGAGSSNVGAGGLSRVEFIREYKTKAVVGNTSSAYKHSLQEILTDPKFQARIVSTKTATQTAALESLCQRLHSEPDRVCYGVKEVVQAIEEDAVEELLVLDKLIRDMPTVQRLNFVKLMEHVKHTGGKVLVFSEKHVSGELLKQMTGVAASLRWELASTEH